MTSQPTENRTESWFEIVQQKVGALRFGSVQITVHEGRVTQVECTEKTRLPGGLSTISSVRPPGQPQPG